MGSLRVAPWPELRWCIMFRMAGEKRQKLDLMHDF